MPEITDITMSSYTLGATATLPDRIRIAAEAGFSGIGISAVTYMAAKKDGLTDAHLFELLETYHMAVTEVELITDWGTLEDRTPEQRQKEHMVFHLARLFGVRHVNVSLFQKLPGSQVVSALRELCHRAEGLEIGLEFMPYGGIPSLSFAWHAIELSGCSNASLIIDSWHWTRAHQTPLDLIGIPASKIVSIQIEDVQKIPQDNLREESLHARLPAGTGYGNTASMLQSLKLKGVTPRIITTEMASDLYLAKGLSYAAKESYAGAKHMIDTYWNN